MRTHPWSQTSLGSVGTWPVPLQTTLGILLNAAMPMIGVWGRDRLIFYNDACSALWPESSGSSIGQSLKQLLLAEKPQKSQFWQIIANATEAVFASGEPTRSETVNQVAGQVNDQTGSISWIYSPVWDEQGQVGGVFATGSPQVVPAAPFRYSLESPDHQAPAGLDCQREIATLRQVEDDLRIIAGTIPVLISFIDKQQRYCFNNHTYETWFGRPASETYGQYLWEVLGEEAYSTIRPHVEQVLAGETVTYESQVDYKTGGKRYIQATYVPQFDSQGAVRGFVALVSDISDRHRNEAKRQQAENALRDSEALKQSILNSSSDCIKVLDEAGQIVYINEGGRSTLETDSLEPVLDRRWVDFWQGEDHEKAQAVLSAARLGHYGRMQGYCPTFKGNPKWWDVVVTPLKDASGEVTKTVVISRDITEQKQYEAALQENQRSLSTIISNLPGFVYRCRADWKMEYLSDKVQSIAGYQAADFLDNIAWRELVHPDDLENLAAQAAAHTDSKTPIRATYRIIDIQGNIRWVWDRATPMFSETGELIHWEGFVTDISDRQQFEASLRESEERFRNLADNISQFTWMANESGWIFWYNRRWFDYTGTTLKDMQGWGWRQVHHPDYVDRVVEKFSGCIARGETWEDTFPLRGQDGKYRWFLSRAVPLRNDQGQVVRWFGTNTDVTDLRETELALQQATDRLDIALKSAPITLFNQDQELRYTWIYNPTHDFAQGEVLGYRDDELLPAEVVAHLTRLKQQVLDTGVGGRSEVRVEPNYYDLTVDPIRDEQGVVVGITCAAVDITQRLQLEADRQRAEDTLRQSEDRLRMAVESAQLGTWDWNLVTNELIWDSGCKAMFGLPVDAEVTIDRFYEGLHPDDRDWVERVVRDCLDPTLSNRYDIDYRTVGIDDGLERWISAKGQVYFDASDTPRRFTGTVLDITERKRFEQALMESEAIARTQAEELAALMQATPAAIWIAHDPGCHRMTANRMAYELMGSEPGASATATPEDGESTLLYRQFKNGEEMLPQDLPMQKAIRTQQEVTDQIEFVFPDGTVRYIYGRAVPLYGSDGGVRGAIGGFAEITAFKEAEQERELLLQRERSAREEAERANRIKDDFLAVLSHELRSPLNPILGWSKLLRMGRLDAAKTEKALETIERNAKLQAQLVDDLLDLAKILRGKLHLEQAPVSLATVVEAALENVKMAAAAKAITLDTDLNGEIQVTGDAGRLQQIVWNLLSNAIKFTPEGGQAKIQLNAIEGKAQIVVTDSGVGISPDFLPHIFESFRQEDVSITRQHGGLGLGLAIVRRLVEAHGGTIIADSLGEGQGSTFTVQLPLIRVQSAHPDASSSASPDLDLSGLKILAVDDSPDAREFLTVLLGQYGAQVVTAASAAIALDILSDWRPDLVISDIGMPDVDGYGLIRQIRELPPEQGGQTQAIALTAYAREDDQQRAIACGYQRHLSKPLDIERLVRTILELTQR